MSESANQVMHKPLSDYPGPGKLLGVLLGSGMVERVPDGAIPVQRFNEILRACAKDHGMLYDPRWFWIDDLDWVRVPLLSLSIEVQRVQVGECDDDCFVGIREVAPDDLNMILFKNASFVLDQVSARALTAPLLRYSGYYESGDNKPVIRLLETLFRDAGDPFYFRDFGPPIPLVMDHITSFCMKSVRHM